MSERINSIAIDSVALTENTHVQELIAILKDNGKDVTGLLTLLEHVKNMEQFCNQAESKIDDMKLQLGEMKEIKNHPIRTALQNTIKSLDVKVGEVKAQLSILKTSIITGCKNAVEAFKEKGIEALDKLVSFLRVKSCLEKVNSCTASAVKDCDKAIKMVESFSLEYRKTGLSIKNMARILLGKEPLNTVAESGKLSKAFCAPARAERACMISIQETANSMIKDLEQLSEKANISHDVSVTTKKPSLIERLNDKKEYAKQKSLENTPPELPPKMKGLEI